MDENRVESATKSQRKCSTSFARSVLDVCVVQYKNFASNQPELYRPNDNDDDDVGAANITAKEIEQEAKEVGESFR